MNSQQFSDLGPFSMVRVLHPDLLGESAPTPPVVTPPADPLAPLRAWKSEGLAILDEDDRQWRAKLSAWVDRMPV